MPQDFKSKKGRKGIFRFYFRLLRTSAAAATIITTTDTPIATYVIVGEPLVGGGAILGEGEAGAVVAGGFVAGGEVSVGDAVTEGTVCCAGPTPT